MGLAQQPQNGIRGRGRISHIAPIAFVGVFALATLAGWPARALAQEESPGLSPDSGPAVHYDTSPPLSSLTPSNTSGHAFPARETPPSPAASSQTSAQDTSGVQLASPLSPLIPSPSVNFDGVPENPCDCVPPDPSGAVGATQYVEVVNTELAVYSKTGEVLLKPEGTNTLWQGFTEPGEQHRCEKDNDGDSTVLYDALAQRWVVQQFAVEGGYLDCVAISETSDATGKWHRYSFQYEEFPDYPKMGVWPDAYYASFNLFGGAGFEGAEVCAFDRAKMLEGQAASQQCFTRSAGSGSSLLPATVDGSTPPPSGEQEWFLALSPTEVNALAYWKFHVDWSNPENTTFTGPTNLPVEAFSEACGGGTCIPQAETSQQLESLADRMMFRLAYRNFGDHEAMVVTDAVTAGSSAGIRWYELRPSSGSLTVYQQGTYAPDSSYRWMGSIAMDQDGDMALGYSVSSSSLHPQVRYTGRLATDPLGTMPEGEATLYEGAGSQLPYGTRAGSRWGDYTEMSVDPSDGCTFWYVNEYLPSNGDFNWHTRIGSFKFPGCRPAPSVTTEAASYTDTFEPQLNATINPEGSDTHYQFEYGLTKAYGHKIPATAEDVGSGTTAMAVSQTLSGLERNKTYHFRVLATNVGGTTYGQDGTFTTLPPCKGAEEQCVWSTQTTVDPSPISEDRLNGVSCMSSTMCMAVGRNLYKEDSFLELWNGTQWSVHNSASGELNAVSCVSTSWCMTVGQASTEGIIAARYTKLFGETWSGSTKTLPLPAGATRAHVGGVSCISTSACTAVGYYEAEAGGFVPLAERWNGSEWSVQSTPLPGEPGSATEFRSVSCGSATECLAVGTSDAASFSERWNGAEWSVLVTPNPAGYAKAELEGVSCPSTTFCMAGGHFSESSGPGKTLTESWDGSKWTIRASPNPSEAEHGVSLSGVSCLSSNSCFAVGSYGGRQPLFEGKTLAESWNGSSWTIQSSPSPRLRSSLVSDSCTSSIACTAVGSGEPGPSGEPVVTLAESWNGTQWSTQNAINPATGAEDKFDGVSCMSSTKCRAVGRNLYKEDSFLESWNGTAWKDIGKRPTGELKAISCVSTSWCMTVGQASGEGVIGGRYTKVFGETWYGSPAMLPTPEGGTLAHLGSVSCTSTSDCIAVGYYEVESGTVIPLAESWNGAEWSVQSAALPGGPGSATEFRGVSCSSASMCVAVGVSDGGSFSERWDGTEWSILSTPSPDPALTTAPRVSRGAEMSDWA